MERRGSKFIVRLCTLLLAVVLLCAFGVVALAADTVDKEPVCYNHGDLNGDGVIDNRDAIYTLYHFMYGEEKYPVEQDWDFNGDGEHSNKDAIYVLYASLFADDPDYQLKGFVHSYYDPAWEWSEEDGAPVAQVSFKCGCGEDHVFVTEEGGVSVATQIKKNATCLEAGIVEHVASIEFDGKEYTNTKTESVPTLKHELNGFQDCENSAACRNCDLVLPALGHNWEKSGETVATCTKRAVITYECGTCHTTRNEETGEFADHELVRMEGRDLVEGCKHTEQYQCKNCPIVVDGTAHYEHDYEAQIIAATCVSEGSKTYVCRKCQEPQLDDDGNPKVEVLKNADAHNWVETAEGSGIFHCQNDGCGAEKKTVNAVDTAVSKDDLADANEMKLSNDGAAMAVDNETLDKLQVQQSIQVTVTAVDVAQSGLSEAQQAQIPGDVVYNFEMKVDGTEKTEFETPITISLPYTPEEGEDLDAIDVWYIDDEGNAKSFKGVYSNGFVTFTTTHFSYYTVTRMTPAERCARYGHIEVATHKDPSCIEDGYDLVQCQRCGVKSVDKKLAKIGHDYKETVKNATCTEEGSVIKVCQNEGCKSYLTEKIPALGHKMEKNKTLSVDATCEAPGKEVLSCAREGCTEQTETVLAQLSHIYKLHEQKDPDCVNKGHKKNKCELCGKIETENEKAPTGHDYLPENAVWSWSEDHKTATVTLVCAYNSKHTKELTAVVSSETKTESSCLGSGAITYTAVAKFNKAEFTNTVTVTQAAAGHKPDSNWAKDASGHWHVCSVCEDKVDVAFHNWNEGKVITEPTCAESGETLYTCTVCGYEKTVTVKATGAHDYHFGVCKNCGFGKSTCTHEMIHTLEADVSEYGLCEGAKFFWISCDCGENKVLQVETVACNFGEPVTRQETDKYGTPYPVQVFTCPDCGLVGESYSYPGVDEENCKLVFVQGVRIIKDGKVLADMVEDRQDTLAEHPTRVVVKKTDLSQYGLCGLTVIELACPCGQNSSFGLDVENGCQFQYDPNNMNIETCVKCGAQIVSDMHIGKGDTICTTVRQHSRKFYFGGELIYTYEWTNTSEYHTEKVTGYELLGENCEDGVVLTYQCYQCENVRTRKVFYHDTCITKETKFSGHDTCMDTLVQSVCPCGERKDAYVTGNGYCNWYYYDMDGDGEDEHMVCWTCGMSREITVSYGEKDEYCNGLAYFTDTYRDKNGELLAKGYRVQSGGFHNLERTVTLLGETCEEGVLIADTCKDCGYHEEWESYWHYKERTASFDLSSFDMCASKGVLETCLCGEEQYFDYIGGQCDWQWIGGFEGGNIEQCTLCGIVKKEGSKLVKSEDLCHSIRNVTLEFLRDGKSLGKFSFDRIESRHFYVTEMELYDETAGCLGGVRGTSECIVCGHTETFEIHNENFHPCFVTELEILCQDGLCGVLTKATVGCACGQESWTDVEWHGDSCWFNRGEYSQELGQWVEVCEKCGAQRAAEREETPIEGTTCGVQATEHVKLYQNGKLLCEYDTTHTYENHTFLHTFELVGATCEEGYYVTRTCALCGYSFREDHIYYGCEEHLIDIVTVYDGTDTCSPVYIRKNSCACGANTNAYLTEWDCSFEWVGHDEKTGYEIWRCAVCGLERTGKQNTVKLPNSCDAQRILDYTYRLNGETVGTVNESFPVKEHSLEYSFQLQGASCEDGFMVSMRCRYCSFNRSEDWYRWGHEYFELLTIDLSQYGMCGGHVRIHGCACGQERGYDEYTHCNWRTTGKTDPDTGLEERYCSDCDTYIYFGTVGEKNADNCVFSGNFIYKAVRGSELIVNVCEPIEEYRHIFKMVGANFDSEDRNCNSGVTILRECAGCGKTNEYHTWSHDHITDKYIDLSAAGFACGGVLQSGGCACGEETFLHWGVECDNMSTQNSQTTDAEGIVHYFDTSECGDCGLKLVEEWYTKQVEGCKYARYETVDVYKDGQVIETLSVKRPEYHHEQGEVTYSLREGSQTCEDGLNVSWNCTECGQPIEGVTYDHGMNKTDTVIDLAKYGSICGAQLRLYQCPCGKAAEYRFTEDSKCDITQYSDTLWITDVVNGDQPNVDGHLWLHSYANRLGCGVTDPDPCGLELFKATYWKVENCIATQYTTWRMGYDATTDTWDQEITVSTGHQEAWHDYQETNTDNMTNGTGTQTWRLECKNCGSYREVVETWQNNQMMKRVEDTYNALDFGHNRRHYIVDENGLEVQSKVYPDESYWLPTSSKHTWTRINGDVFEEWWTRTYDFSGSCKATTHYYHSDGGSWTENHDGHVVYSEWEMKTPPTCTQFGELVCPCRICGDVEDDQRQIAYPTMHQFNWDSDKEKYVCTVCKLESVRGYSGSIAMEDMTEATGTDYVIGYWNSGEIEFMPTVSVMLYDVNADENDELVLTGIQFNYHTVEDDGFTGLSFNKAAAQAAADQAIAEAGYSGSYGIRISFVPINTQDELDYAITFDTQNTAE